MDDNTVTDDLLVSRADVPKGFYFVIDRQYAPTQLAVGPYPTEKVAESAMNDSVLADDLCQTDCLDANVSAPDDLDLIVELYLIDPANDHHHGPVR